MLLSEEEIKEISEIFSDKMEQPVKVTLFHKDSRYRGNGNGLPYDERYCRQAETLVGSICSLTEKITYRACDVADEAELARKYGVARLPAILIVSHNDYGIRHYGVPSGYDFAAFLNSLLEVSHGVSELGEKTRARIRALKSRVNIKVFVSPSCPFCPIATHFANQFALESNLIFCESINTSYFPELAEQYNVRALPTVIINETERFVGLTTESQFMEHIQNSLKRSVDNLETARARQPAKGRRASAQ